MKTSGAAKNGRLSVQASGIQRRRTDLPIDVSVQTPGREPVHLRAEVVRANLSAVFRGENIVIVRGSWRTRAVIIPIEGHGWQSDENRKARGKRLRAQLEQVLEKELE